MGRNTFESIGKPLPNRRTIIITRNTSYQKEGCEVVHSLEDAIELIASQEDAFIIGGAQIYKEAMEKNVVDQLDITKVHQDFDADVFFPAIDSMVWEEVSRENFSPDEKNLFTYSFINYKKTV
jgi:dihydrofolate reductase